MLFQTQQQQQQQTQQVVMLSGKGMNNCYTSYELGNGITAIRTTSATSTTAEAEVVSESAGNGPGGTSVVNFPTDLGQPVSSAVTALQREQDVSAHVQTATSGYPTATANLMSPAGRQQSSPMTIMLLIPQPDGTMLLQPTTPLQNTACYSRLNTHNGGMDCI
ncbi:unnamed protein product, partial [Dibothriocephalus latus]